ncbi:hypothetical protein [uncultured Comamonas sp.]|uniref:hypothetical protein n=1 Tax=uncultured Comamonas sp. TaxID=114710 RepID=UPI0025D72FA3|nr:hypothetical protein [uncultured Comamonas sp.]
MTDNASESPVNNPPSAQVLTSDALRPVESVETGTSGSKSSAEGDPVPASSKAADKQPEASTKPSEAWWLKHLKEHPFKALSLAVSIYGGLILLVFFVQLGSMPDLDLAGAAATLAAVAVIGLLVVVALGVSTIAAGGVTRVLALDVPHLTSKWSLVSMALPGGIFIAAVAIAAVCEAVHFNSWWLGALLGASLVAPFIGCCYQLHQQKKNPTSAPAPATPSSTVVPTTETVKNGSAETQEKNSNVFWVFYAYVASGFVWCVSVLMVFMTYDALASHGGASSKEAGVGLILWGVISILLNILVVKAPPKIQGFVFLVLGGASVVILTTLTASWSAIPVTVVRTLGLGEIPVGVVVTAEGCDIFNKAARGQKVCQMDADQKQGWVCPAILKSRIGAPMVFELTSIGDNGSWPILRSEIEAKRLGRSVSHQRYQRIQVAKSEVKSWPSITPLPRLKDPEPASNAVAQGQGIKRAGSKDDASKDSSAGSRRLVTYLNPSVVAGSPEQKQWLEEQCGAMPRAEGVTTAKPGTVGAQRKSNSGKKD